MINNKSVVRNMFGESYYSSNDYAYVHEENVDLLTHFNLTKNINNSIVRSNLVVGNYDLDVTRITSSYGLTPHTVEVISDYIYQKEFPGTRLTVKDTTNLDNNIIGSKKVYVYKSEPTNLNYSKPSVVVYQDVEFQNDIQLTGTTVNINSKAEIVLPESSSYEDISLTIQKNCFIEIKLPENTIEVMKLPGFLTYGSGYIKGTYTKSGNYTIIVAHPDGEQVIDITVPYYERLL